LNDLICAEQDGVRNLKPEHLCRLEVNEPSVNALALRRSTDAAEIESVRRAAQLVQ
jgi:hypothetical protein